MKNFLKKVNLKIILGIITISVILSSLISLVNRTSYLNYQNKSYEQENTEAKDALAKVATDLQDLQNQDQIKINEDLTKEIDSIHISYQKAVTTYENLLDLKEKTDSTQEEDSLFAEILTNLSNLDYEKANENISLMSVKIKESESRIAESFTIPETVTASNAPPNSGYLRQQVATEIGNFMVSIVSADISTTKVIVDTASGGDCGNDCPTLPLATYISRNGAYAGVNGSYFCPATYPSCAGKTNTFDTLLMNKDKVYFNSDNNVYSGNPAVIFGGGYVRFVSQASQWGRDTGIDSMISNYPLLLMGGNITFGGDDDPKKGSKGNRSFVANKGNNIYIGVVHSATVAESAHTMKALGMENALNLDNGGSTALWHGGYKAGPGRNLPNVILFVNK